MHARNQKETHLGLAAYCTHLGGRENIRQRMAGGIHGMGVIDAVVGGKRIYIESLPSIKLRISFLKGKSWNRMRDEDYDPFFNCNISLSALIFQVL